MTTLASIKAVMPTANAKTVTVAKGSDINVLMALLQQKVSEVIVLTTQIIALHPTGGGDAANLTALQNILTSLA